MNRTIFYFLLIAVLFACNSQKQVSDLSSKSDIELEAMADQRGYIVQVGDKVPNIEFELIDGSKTSIKKLKGKVIMLQFTASWCSVCRKEMPHIENEIWLPNKDKDFVVIGVDRDEPIEKVEKFIRQMKTTYPVALDPGADIFGQFALKKSGVTRNVIIDKKGRIVFLTRLFDLKEFEAMKNKIEELLNS